MGTRCDCTVDDCLLVPLELEQVDEADDIEVDLAVAVVVVVVCFEWFVTRIGFKVVVVRAPRTEVNALVGAAVDVVVVDVGFDIPVISLWILVRLADLLAVALDKVEPAKLDWLVCFERIDDAPVAVRVELLLAGRFAPLLLPPTVAPVAGAVAVALRRPVADDGLR